MSYPRTESTKYDPKGFNVQQILRDHSKHDEWGKTANHLLRTKYSNNSSPPARGRDVGDHPPITCLKAARRDEVGGGIAWRVYDFISRTFIGSLGDDLRFTRRTFTLELASPLAGENRPRFEIDDVSVDSVGFAAACTWVLNDIGAKKDSELLNLQPGMRLDIRSIRAEPCATRPPPFVQEHELIELMDKNRIGTDASMATHVSNIVDRGYVVLCDETGVPIRPPRRPSARGKPLPRQIGRYLVPTSLGMSLMNLFNDTTTSTRSNSEVALLSRPEIRARMEEEVKTIATGDLDKQACLESNLNWFRSQYIDFFESLSRQRLGVFERSMEETKATLKRWKNLGAFETPKAGTTSEPRNRQKSPTKRGGKFQGRGNKQKNTKPAKSKRRVTTNGQKARKRVKQ